MKIYVDELPKSCNDCKFRVFIAYTKNGWEHSERYCSIMKDNYDCNCSKEHCPLLLLTDYTKQVRKEVCEEIKSEIIKHHEWKYEDCYTNSDVIECVLDIIEENLDQIQGENNVQG